MVPKYLLNSIWNCQQLIFNIDWYKSVPLFFCGFACNVRGRFSFFSHLSENETSPVFFLPFCLTRFGFLHLKTWQPWSLAWCAPLEAYFAPAAFHFPERLNKDYGHRSKALDKTKKSYSSHFYIRSILKSAEVKESSVHLQRGIVPFLV